MGTSAYPTSFAGMEIQAEQIELKVFIEVDQLSGFNVSQRSYIQRKASQMANRAGCRIYAFDGRRPAHE